MTNEIKWVVMEPVGFRGAFRPKRGLQFATQDEAAAWIVNNIREKSRFRYHVESRTVKADDMSERMTCQCCGVKYLARNGSVAHHGYTRPGGYQTASCMGAKHLPFENDHKLADQIIVWIGEQIERTQKLLRDVRADKAPVRMSVTDYTAPQTRFGRPSIWLDLTAENFTEETTKENVKRGWSSLYLRTFADAKDKYVAKLQRDLKNMHEHKAERVKFRATWKHTHNYNKAIKEWVAV